MSAFRIARYVCLAGLAATLAALVLAIALVGGDPGSDVPRIGADHWHAAYTYYVCGEKQPNAPTWEGAGVHTHGDGVIHIHPFTKAEEGLGASLVKWFEYGGGKLDDDEIRLPGFSKVWKNGEACPEGTPDGGEEGVVQIFVNGEKLDDWGEYVPADGDRIQMVFGPEQDVETLDDRTVIPDQVTSSLGIEISGDETQTRFTPATINVQAGEIVEIVIRNVSPVSHGLRFAGPDGEYQTADDYVAVPWDSDPATADQGDLVLPGKLGVAVVRFDDPGEYEFKDPTSYATGVIIVGP